MVREINCIGFVSLQVGHTTLPRFMSAMSARAPIVPTESFSADVAGVPTEVMVLEFDQVMAIVTQVDRLGTLLQAKQDAYTQTYSVEVLLGRRNDPLLEVLARQLIERLAVAKCQKDLTLWVGLLRSDDPESIKGVIEAICAKSRVFGGGDRSNE